jgi:hypothetical protein
MCYCDVQEKAERSEVLVAGTVAEVLISWIQAFQVEQVNKTPDIHKSVEGDGRNVCSSFITFCTKFLFFRLSQWNLAPSLVDLIMLLEVIVVEVLEIYLKFQVRMFIVITVYFSFLDLSLSESVRASALCLLLPAITRILFLSGAISFVQPVGKDGASASWINSLMQKSVGTPGGVPTIGKQSLHCSAPSSIPLPCANVIVLTAFIDRGGLDALANVEEGCVRRLNEIRLNVVSEKCLLKDSSLSLLSEVCVVY